MYHLAEIDVRHAPVRGVEARHHAGELGLLVDVPLVRLAFEPHVRLRDDDDLFAAIERLLDCHPHRLAVMTPVFAAAGAPRIADGARRLRGDVAEPALGRAAGFGRRLPRAGGDAPREPGTQSGLVRVAVPRAGAAAVEHSPGSTLEA